MKFQRCLTCGTTFTDKPWIDDCPICKSKLITHKFNEYEEHWENYGDINFIEFGGSLIRPSFNKEAILEEPDLKYCFDVFILDTPFDLGEGDNVYRARYFSCIDVTEFEDCKKDLLYTIGQEEFMDIPWLELFDGNMKMLAVELAECNFVSPINAQTLDGQYGDTGYVSIEELYQFFTAFNVDESFIPALNDLNN